MKENASPFLAGFREPTDVIEEFVDGHGCRLVARTGKTFLDFSSQYWNVNLGHRNPKLQKRLHEAVNEHLFVNLRFGETKTPRRLAEELLSKAGSGYEAVQFMTSGSMAVEAAIKTARQVTGREDILSLHQSYHGMSLGALWSTGYDGIVLPFGRRDERHLFVQPFRCSLCPYGLERETCGVFCADEMVRLIHEKGDQLAAVLAEPVISNQVITPPWDFWPRISQACRESNVLLIADEVVSGMGRCGDWFGSEKVGMVPDMICLGKGMTGGSVPLAALVHSDKTAGAWKGKTLLHGQTFDGYDLGCRAALALIDIIEKYSFLKRVRSLSEELATGLEKMKVSIAAIHDVRGWGLLWGIEISPEAIPDASLHPFAIELQKRLHTHGLLLGGLGRVVIFAPPFVISESDLKEGMDIARSTIHKTINDFSE